MSDKIYGSRNLLRALSSQNLRDRLDLNLRYIGSEINKGKLLILVVLLIKVPRHILTGVAM